MEKNQIGMIDDDEKISNKSLPLKPLTYKSKNLL